MQLRKAVFFVLGLAAAVPILLVLYPLCVLISAIATVFATAGHSYDPLQAILETGGLVGLAAGVALGLTAFARPRPQLIEARAPRDVPRIPRQASMPCLVGCMAGVVAFVSAKAIMLAPGWMPFIIEEVGRSIRGGYLGLIARVFGFMALSAAVVSGINLATAASLISLVTLAVRLAAKAIEALSRT